MDRNQTLCCSDVEEMLPLVAEGLIDVENDEAVFEHLADCDHCQQQLVEHDTITLAMSHGRDLRAAPQRAEVIDFRLTRPLAAAAAVLLLAFGSALSYISQNDAAHDLPIDTASLNEPETQILEVLPPQGGDDVPLIIIRHQDQTMIIRQDQIDSGTDNDQIDASVPVTVRY